MFLESAERFVRFHGNFATLKNFVERLILQDKQDNTTNDEDEDIRKNEVTLMTLHSSKGLEFKKVFLVGMEEELLPHKKTIKENGDIGEELRLCYVGITRAEQELIMTYCKERKIYGKKTPRHHSRFLLELDKEGLYDLADCTQFGHLGDEEAQEYKKNFFSNLMESLD